MAATPPHPGDTHAAEIDPAVFDPEEFRETLGSDELAQTLIDLFPEEAELHTEITRSAFQTGHLEDLHRATHALRGLLGNYAARSAFDQACTVDDLVRKSKVIEARAAFNDCLGEMEKLQAALVIFRKSLKN